MASSSDDELKAALLAEARASLEANDRQRRQLELARNQAASTRRRDFRGDERAVRDTGTPAFFRALADAMEATRRMRHLSTIRRSDVADPGRRRSLTRRRLEPSRTRLFPAPPVVGQRSGRKRPAGCRQAN